MLIKYWNTLGNIFCCCYIDIIYNHIDGWLIQPMENYISKFVLLIYFKVII
jgi:hypothetical protein